MNTKKFSSVSMHYPTEREALFSSTSDDFFAAIDQDLDLSDLRRCVERAIFELDPERERKHQEERTALAAFIRQAQVVLEAYAKDSQPHPQWSERQLRRVLEHTTVEMNYTIRQRNHFAQFAPEHVIEWQHADGTSHSQRNDEYRSEVAQTIAAFQSTISQCIAIMKDRGLKA